MRDGEDSVKATTSRTAATHESQSQHTPGPWTIEPGDDGGDASVGMAPTATTIFAGVPNDDQCRFAEIATMHEPVYGNNEDGDPLYFGDATANARLIAAAPDLLAALRICRAIIGCGSRGARLRVEPEAIAQAEAAIAKAEGR